MIELLEYTEYEEWVSAVVRIPSHAVSHLPVIMTFAQIREIGPGSNYGYAWDCQEGTLSISQPIFYKGRIFKAIELLKQKYQPTFHPVGLRS